MSSWDAICNARKPNCWFENFFIACAHMAQPASSQLAEDHHSLGGLLHIYRYDYFRYQCLIESTGQVQGFKLLRSLRQLFCMSSALWCDFHSDFCIFFDLHTLHVKKPKRNCLNRWIARPRALHNLSCGASMSTNVGHWPWLNFPQRAAKCIGRIWHIFATSDT